MINLKNSIEELRRSGVETNYKPIRFGNENSENDFKVMFNYFVPNYVHLPEYDEIIKWLKDNERKGLALFGTSGQGKSVILKSVLPNIFFSRYNIILHPINSYKLTNDYKVKRYEVIDEVGNEPNMVHFGTKLNILAQIIDECEEKKSLLMIAGNITADQFIEKYGKPIYDRIVNITKIINFKSKTLRK